MTLKLHLVVAALKMFVRQKEALIWTILLPLFMVFLFSFVKFDGVGSVNIGLVDRSGDTSLVSTLGSIGSVKVHSGSEDEELVQLKAGDRAAIVILPSSFRPGGGGDSVTMLLNAEKRQEAQLAMLMVERALDDLAHRHDPNLPRQPLRTRVVNSRNLTYIDFLLPGVLAMSIMQAGVFGVAFGFVILKKRGILRRLLVTPMRPADFLISQIVMRLLVLTLQVVIMVGAGVLFFHLHFIGSIVDMLVVGILGGVVFLAIGFALSGISKSEDQVAPLANIVSLPMMLLSGVFFSRSNLPGFAHAITAFFPLTYLADGLRAIAIDGATLVTVWPQILGLAAWGVITVFLAVKAFRWE